jgi:[ribosomal protein S5]-alanine N-acetyltransferase
MLELVQIKETLAENSEFESCPECHAILHMTLDYYRVIGYNPPWIGYFAKIRGKVVGSGGYKGKPVDNKIEIAYGTLPEYENQGIGTRICRSLVLLALRTDKNIIITARTLPENGFSSKILQKNNFRHLGIVWDKDDGYVWEWLYEGPKTEDEPIISF